MLQRYRVQNSPSYRIVQKITKFMFRFRIQTETTSTLNIVKKSKVETIESVMACPNAKTRASWDNTRRFCKHKTELNVCSLSVYIENSTNSSESFESGCVNTINFVCCFCETIYSIFVLFCFQGCKRL